MEERILKIIYGLALIAVGLTVVATFGSIIPKWHLNASMFMARRQMKKD